MSSVIEICNVALGQVRDGSINSLTEGSLQAQLCSLHYEKLRDKMLSDADWGFNRKIVALAKLSDVTIFNWSYVWQQPSECLYINRLIRDIEEFTAETDTASPTRLYPLAARLYPFDMSLMGKMPEVEYERFNNNGTKVIATREPVMRMDYRSKIVDPNLFSMDFELALSSLLAAYIAIPLAGVKDGRILKADALQLFNGLKNEADVKSANQGQSDIPLSDFITIRN